MFTISGKHAVVGDRRGWILGVPLAAIALLMAIIGGVGAASAESTLVPLVNSGFESGSTSGWQANVDCEGECDDGDYIQVVRTFHTDNGTYDAQDGNHFAVLEGACHDSTLAQTFNAEAGQALSGQAFFAVGEDAGDVSAYNDYGRVELFQDGTLVQTLFSATAEDVGGENGTPWVRFSYTIPTDGVYTIVATSGNDGDCDVDSYLGIDFPSDVGQLTVTPQTQLWGQAITITSERGGLTGTTSVLMNGSPAPFVVLNDSNISAMVVPGAGMGAVDLVVTSPGGTVLADKAFTAIAPVVVQLPTATPSATSTPSPSATATPSTTATATPTGTATATPTPTDQCPAPDLELGGAVTLTTWPGPDGAAIGDTLSSCGLSKVTAIWSFDASNQTWLGWFAGSGNVSGANDITTFKIGTAYFFLQEAAG